MVCQKTTYLTESPTEFRTCGAGALVEGANGVGGAVGGGTAVWPVCPTDLAVLVAGVSRLEPKASNSTEDFLFSLPRLPPPSDFSFCWCAFGYVEGTVISVGLLGFWRY